MFEFVFVLDGNDDDENGCPLSRPLPPDTHCALNVSTHAPLQASYCSAPTRYLASTTVTFKSTKELVVHQLGTHLKYYCNV